MQLLSGASKESDVECAQAVLEAAPGLVWYIRLHMRKHRKGLSVAAFRALVKVGDVPGASLSVVAEHLGASLPTASRIVGKLVARGFLRRSGSRADRRQVELHLTARGRGLVDAAHAATRAQMEADIAGLSDGERGQVSAAMVILRDLFESLGFSGTTAPADAENGRPYTDEALDAGKAPTRRLASVRA
jgi:DNA-binding MarR family transcriptional regulator